MDEVEQTGGQRDAAGAGDAGRAGGAAGAGGAATAGGAAGAREMSSGRRDYLTRRERAASLARPEPVNLADILERVLDKGIVIAGDIQINLLEIELLTIKLRLLIASVDRAREMGINWWESDSTLSSNDRSELEDENRRLRERLEALERKVGVLPEGERDERRS